MSSAKKKPKPKSKPLVATRVADELSDPDAMHVLASLDRIRDPMTRYLVAMLIDRLTQGISVLERGEAAHETEGESVLMAAARPKPN